MIFQARQEFQILAKQVFQINFALLSPEFLSSFYERGKKVLLRFGYQLVFRKVALDVGDFFEKVCFVAFEKFGADCLCFFLNVVKLALIEVNQMREKVIG